MKNLYLLRHAKSSWASPGMKDFDRPLNERGLADAPDMAVRLKASGAGIDRIITSPALRTLTTARLVAATLGLDNDVIREDRQIYLAGSPRLMHVLSLLDEELNGVLLVAHNPALTDLANDVARAGIDNLPTAGLVHIELPIEHWFEIGLGVGRVVNFDYPRNHD